eukprot:GHVQ01026910.1.p1 GENE.GHVQ01026910.1~~GHVQ01026910.1.p1  ORF type:complete len:514 (-),score=60.18 GHVQ01026910.1:2106-3647(-)
MRHLRCCTIGRLAVAAPVRTLHVTPNKGRSWFRCHQESRCLQDVGPSRMLNSVSGSRNQFTRGWPTHHKDCKTMHTSATRLGLVNFKLADIGEGIAEVELLKWHKKTGDALEEMEAVCEVQSDKAAVEITSRYTGKILNLKHNVGDMIKIGDVLLSIDVEGDGEPLDQAAASTVEASSPDPTVQQRPASLTGTACSSGESVAVPAARRLAKELGVDINLVKGSGKHGRISKEDVENFHKSGGAVGGAPCASAAQQAVGPMTGHGVAGTPTAPVGVMRPPRENVQVLLRGYARAMAKSMTETAKIPHLNIGDEFDITELVALRLKMKSLVQKEHNMKLTMTPWIVKAVSLALNKHPILNSKFDNESQYTMYGSHNISIAIDTSNGLVVPNIKNVQDLSVLEIQSELFRLQQLAASNKLSPGDLTGGTVSISNVGVIAGTYVKALLFDNQAMIIGLGRTHTVPKFDSNGQVVPRQVMHCAFSADHRHCDGATVARYNAELKRYLESPELMVLYMC